MNLQIREALRSAVREQGLTHAKLAERLGITQPSVSQLLNGSYGKVPQSLIEVLDVLGLELTVTKASDTTRQTAAQARAQAMALLTMDPWGKGPAGLAEPVPAGGPAFEALLTEQRGPEL
jgi:transcriptional regulator with XRE-family HTH domain